MAIESGPNAEKKFEIHSDVDYHRAKESFKKAEAAMDELSTFFALGSVERIDSGQLVDVFFGVDQALDDYEREHPEVVSPKG